jgi:signal transduction histidine kinase
VLDVSVTRLPSQVENAAYFVIAEAVTNVAKHANATVVTVTVSLSREWLDVTIIDDGMGGASPLGGGGLSGLRDRLDILGGKLDIATSEGAGTTVRAAIPLNAP